MKKMLFFVCTFLAVSFTTPDDSISKKEREFATRFLTESENRVVNTLKGLSEAQLTYKSAPDRWSAEECAKHIAAAEMALWHLADSIIKQAANPDARAEIKATDEQLVQMIENRTQKAKAPEMLRPEKTPFKSASEALASFQTNREKLLAYVTSTKEDLRNHVATLPPGKVDAYQLLLFIGAHSNRHTKQIEEVKADPNFPKN